MWILQKFIEKLILITPQRNTLPLNLTNLKSLVKESDVPGPVLSAENNSGQCFLGSNSGPHTFPPWEVQCHYSEPAQVSEFSDRLFSAPRCSVCERKGSM